MPVRREGDDPISLLLAPPPDETDEERALRLQREAEARRISDEIDEQIKKEYAALKKQNVLKMLLLGQSESDIQIIQAPEAWLAERASWRIVIQLNLVRAVNTILDIVSAELSEPASDPHAGYPYPMSPTMSIPINGAFESDDDPDPLYGAPSSPSSQSHFSLPSSPLSMPSPPLSAARPHLHALTAAHSSLWLRLTPLRQVEADLKLLLGAPSEEVTEASLHGDHSTMVATPFEAGAYPLEALPLSPRRREFCVRSHASWKESLRARGGLRGGDVRVSGRHSAGVDATEVIAGCRDDVELLWGDHVIRDILVRRRIGLDNSAE
ncbi:hypothetical protein EIP86_009341 [Pleurotus ostreatoroseus]|nr:hypothetical protein EIP86_009341 [Pleurotus ostreatoroseus]